MFFKEIQDNVKKEHYIIMNTVRYRLIQTEIVFSMFYGEKHIRIWISYYIKQIGHLSLKLPSFIKKYIMNTVIYNIKYWNYVCGKSKITKNIFIDTKICYGKSN